MFTDWLISENRGCSSNSGTSYSVRCLLLASFSWKVNRITPKRNKQGPGLIDLRQKFRVMAGVDFLAWDHYSLQTVFEVKSDLGSEISDLNYLVTCAYCLYTFFGSLWGHFSLQTASARRSDLTSYLKSVTSILWSGISNLRCDLTFEAVWRL